MLRAEAVEAVPPKRRGAWLERRLRRLDQTAANVVMRDRPQMHMRADRCRSGGHGQRCHADNGAQTGTTVSGQHSFGVGRM